MAGIKQNVVVLSASQYNMVNGDTGEIVKGTSVRYALTDTLAPAEEEQLKGYKLAKTSLPYEAYAQFKEVPGIYETVLNFNIAGDGTTKIKASDFIFRKPLFVTVDQKAPTAQVDKK